MVPFLVKKAPKQFLCQSAPHQKGIVLQKGTDSAYLFPKKGTIFGSVFFLSVVSLLRCLKL